jgi:hypothetical protein
MGSLGAQLSAANWIRSCSLLRAPNGDKRDCSQRMCARRSKWSTQSRCGDARSCETSNTQNKKKMAPATSGCGSCEWGRKSTGACAHWIATCMSSVMGHSPAVHAPAVSPISHITGGGTLLQIAELGCEKKKPFLTHASRLAHCPPLSSCTIAASTCAKHIPTCVVGWARCALAGGLRQREPNSAPGHSDVRACVLDNVWCVEVQLPKSTPRKQRGRH